MSDQGRVRIGSELVVHWYPQSEADGGGVFGRTARVFMMPDPEHWNPAPEAGTVWLVTLLRPRQGGGYFVTPIQSYGSCRLDPPEGNDPDVMIGLPRRNSHVDQAILNQDFRRPTPVSKRTTEIRPDEPRRQVGDPVEPPKEGGIAVRSEITLTFNGEDKYGLYGTVDGYRLRPSQHWNGPLPRFGQTWNVRVIYLSESFTGYVLPR